jgi:hypothetical protein
MIKLLILIVAVTGLTIYHWDKVPQPVKNLIWDAKTVSGEVLEKGKDMPSPVKKYVDEKVIPKAKELKDKVVN